MDITNAMMNDPANHAPDDYYKYGKYAGIINALKDSNSQQGGQGNAYSNGSSADNPNSNATNPHPLDLPDINDPNFLDAMKLAIMGTPKQSGGGGGMNLQSIMGMFGGGGGGSTGGAGGGF